VTESFLGVVFNIIDITYVSDAFVHKKERYASLSTKVGLVLDKKCRVSCSP
jgi:hypothetical protein